LQEARRCHLSARSHCMQTSNSFFKSQMALLIRHTTRRSSRLVCTRKQRPHCIRTYRHTVTATGLKSRSKLITFASWFFLTAYGAWKCFCLLVFVFVMSQLIRVVSNQTRRIFLSEVRVVRAVCSICLDSVAHSKQSRKTCDMTASIPSGCVQILESRGI